MFLLFEQKLCNNKAKCLFELLMLSHIWCRSRKFYLAYKSWWIDKVQVVYFSCLFIVAPQFGAYYGGLNHLFPKAGHFCCILVLWGCQLDLGGGWVYRRLHCIIDFIIVCLHIARPLCSPATAPKVEWHHQQSALTYFAFWQIHCRFLLLKAADILFLTISKPIACLNNSVKWCQR